jgi:DNA repair protein RadC
MKKSFLKMKIDADGVPYLAETGRHYNIDGRLTWADSPSKVYKLAQTLGVTDDAEESVYMLCLDTQLKAIAVFEVTHGCLNASLINPREVFQRALMCGAAEIILWHNHPSGNLEPSNEDIKATRRLVEAGKIMGVPLIEHLIITAHTYNSLCDSMPDLF